MSVAEKEKVETFKNFVNGEWKASRNGATFENENPAVRGSNIALFQSSTPEDVREAIDVALDVLDALKAIHPDATRLAELDEKKRAGELSEAQVAEIAATASADPDAEAAMLATARDGGSYRAVRDQCREAAMRASDDLARARRLHETRSARSYPGADGHLVLHAELAPAVGADVRSVLEQLPQRYQQVLLLRLAEDLGFAQIAERLCLTEEATRSLFRRAVAACKRLLVN